MKRLCHRIMHRITLKLSSEPRNSGSYDFEEAQKQYDKVRQLPIQVSTEEEDHFQDCRASSSNSTEEYLDSELYADIVPPTAPPKEVPYDYDVPKISFSFHETEPPKTVVVSEVSFEVSPPRRKSVELRPVVGIIKCGSDPNLVLLRNSSSSDEEGFYKVPRRLDSCRFSRSLNDFKLEEDLQLCTSDQSSIEHVSCSQVLTETPKPKPRFLWSTFRNRFNNIVSEQAAQQRVGAFKEKPAINLDQVYKSSRDKCRTAFKSATKLFKSVSVESESGNGKAQNQVNTKIEEKIEEEERDFDFASIRSAFRRSRFMAEGQNGFEDLRRYVKHGGDFCKELATILQERAEAETQYSKSLSKLSAKLSRACREGVGGLNEAWKAVAVELEARAEIHKLLGQVLLDETAKPLRTLTESQHKSRKICEAAVDKTAKSLADWRGVEAKNKKQSHTCARDNEKLQDAAVLDNTRSGKLTSTSLIHLAHIHNNKSEKENTKLQGKKRKAEDAVKKADVEYYTLCVRAERARLEWESAVMRGVNTFKLLEEERLNHLKTVLTSYLHHSSDVAPRLIDVTERLKAPVVQSEPLKDLSTFINLRQSSQQVSEQLLPDFYCEHITLAMNRERRKQALIKLLHLIRQDIERERKSKNGLEKLSKAIRQTPNFGAEDSQQSVSEKLYHMKSMLTYLEGTRYKVYNALSELDNEPKSGHPLADHITITRDKAGLQQSVLKVPQWLKEEWLETDKSPLSEKSVKSNKSDNSDPHNNDIADADWIDRGTADGNSNQPDSDFDEFSSHNSELDSPEEHPVQPIAQCKALYAYTPNLTDELALQPGDFLAVYRQQDDGWWLGECKGNVGIFPATYVELVNSN